jgi:hypothetical protein
MKATGTAPLRLFPGRERGYWGVCWSPDGKRIAYGMTDVARSGSALLAVADADGRNERVIATEPWKRWDQGGIVAAIDWR